MPRDAFEHELAGLREALLRLATQVESQIQEALGALRTRDAEAADQVASKVKRLQRIIRLEEAVSPLGPELRVLDLERSIEK